MSEQPFALPKDLVATHLHWHGEAGREWLDRLPVLVQTVGRKWQVEIGEPFRHAFSDYAAPARAADGSPVVVKVCFPDDEFAGQEAALQAYDGRSAVRLLASDQDLSALLLERLDPGESLWTQGDDAAQMHIAAEVMRGLWQAVPDEAGVLKRDVWVDEANLPQSLGDLKRSEPWLARVLAQAAELLAEPYDPKVLHGDLHHDNILSSQRGWLAIDPKGLLGDPAWELAPLLYNNLKPAGEDWPRVVRRRIDQLCDELSLDRGRAYLLAAARCLQSRYWSLHEDSVPTHEFILRCADCAEDLAKGP